MYICVYLIQYLELPMGTGYLNIVSSNGFFPILINVDQLCNAPYI